MPPAHVLDSVDVLEVLPEQTRLSGPRLTDDRHVLGAAFARALLAGIDDSLQLGVAAGEGSFDAHAAPGPAGARDHAQCRVRPHRLLAPLDLMQAGVLVGDRRLAR